MNTSISAEQASDITESELRDLVEKLDRRDQPKTGLTQLDIDRVHFVSNHFNEAHPQSICWAIKMIKRGLMN